MTGPTLDEIRRWSCTVDVKDAAKAIGISPSHAYDLIVRGEFPARIITVGSRYRVVTASLVRLLSDDQAA